jgi:CopA family copper-resistance protein
MRENKHTFAVSRRRFVRGMAASAAAAAIGFRGWNASAETGAQAPGTMSGTHFDLTVESKPVNFTGRRSMATMVNGSTPGPTLRWREGDTVTIAVTNRMKEQTSIHWHGVRVPSEMDGVPGLSFAGIPAGETFLYRFPVMQSGTYWYHSHSHFQEQTGLIGAIVIEPRERDAVEFDREYVVLLSDWTDANPETIFSNLKEQSDYYNEHRHSVADFIAEAQKKGFGATASERLMWARMNMSAMDISDVSGATYTFLLNGNAPRMNWTGLFRPGERIRLRIINGSAMTFFDVRIPGLSMTVVQADGNDVEPVTVDEFRIGVAETYDVIVQPKEDAAYTIFAQAEDRSGYARGTLAPRNGMSGVIPPMDPRPVLTMADMGMKMGGMSEMHDMKPGAMHSSGSHAAGDDMGGMKMDSSGMTGMTMESDVGKVPFPQPGPNTTASTGMAASDAGSMIAPSNQVSLHVGPQVDNIPMHVSERLQDPGTGLQNNGRRVLTYADLRARYPGVDRRPPAREIELHLSGNMERYIWGFDGRKFSDARPIQMKLGERLRIVLINDTMMEHPIHLHGLWSELENGHGAFNPYKHTIIVKPAERLSYLVSADTRGRWAYHCHLLYHMEAGMFREVEVI